MIGNICILLPKVTLNQYLSNDWFRWKVQKQIIALFSSMEVVIKSTKDKSSLFGNCTTILILHQPNICSSKYKPTLNELRLVLLCLIKYYI